MVTMMNTAKGLLLGSTVGLLVAVAASFALLLLNDAGLMAVEMTRALGARVYLTGLVGGAAVGLLTGLAVSARSAPPSPGGAH